MNADLELSSEEDRGTRVQISIPLQEGEVHGFVGRANPFEEQKFLDTQGDDRINTTEREHSMESLIVLPQPKTCKFMTQRRVPVQALQQIEEQKG